MISRIEANHYRCLYHVRQSLGPFQVLVGPNASGKTTFLDVLSFLGRSVAEGLDAAIEERTSNFADLLWGRIRGGFQLAVEAAIPTERRQLPNRGTWDTARYEVSVGLSEDGRESVFLGEKLLLKSGGMEGGKASKSEELPREFPQMRAGPSTLLSSRSRKGTRTIVNKGANGKANFYSEVGEKGGKGWNPSYNLGQRKSALANLPEDESRFPVATWLKTFLCERIQQIVLNSLWIRRASPPGQVRGFKPDGSNLPWVIDGLQRNDTGRFRQWIEHLQTAFSDLETIRTVEREDDRHRYLILRYAGGLEVPSWLASDGTLRLLALTIPAYLPEFRGVYLIEEPENGIHPRAVETMVQSLSSVYHAQILLATHSPLILGMVEADKVLCFAKDELGATDIVRGDKHPGLKNWRGEVDLGTLFASGVLG